MVNAWAFIVMIMSLDRRRRLITDMGQPHVKFIFEFALSHLLKLARSAREVI